MKLLLLQARNADDPAGPHERLSFSEILGVNGETLIPWDLLQGPPTEDRLEEFDCVLVGGSGEYGVGDVARYPWLGGFIDFMGALAERKFPTFASCFGFQALVLAGGGAVETDKSRAEVGTFELSVTAAGEADPLFGPVAPRFLAQLGHKDHATRLPAGMTNLAGSERCPHQALRVDGAPIYATQFHPELSMVRNRERFERYLEAYSCPNMVDPPDKVLAGFRESEAASALLRRFFSEVLERPLVG